MDNNEGYTYTDDEGNEIHVGDKDTAENTAEKKDRVHIGFDGIHISAKDGTKVDIGKCGVHVRSADGNVDVGDGKATVNGSEYTATEVFDKKVKVTFPFLGLAALAYVVIVLLSALEVIQINGSVYLRALPVFLFVPLGYSIAKSITERKFSSGVITALIVTVFVVLCILGKLHPYWMILLLIPMSDSIFESVRKKDIGQFAFWDISLIAFLLLGFAPDFGIYDKPLWHPGWVVFILIPVFYSFAAYFKKKK